MKIYREICLLLPDGHEARKVGGTSTIRAGVSRPDFGITGLQFRFQERRATPEAKTAHLWNPEPELGNNQRAGALSNPEYPPVITEELP
jgi:hypothetical protein